MFRECPRCHTPNAAVAKQCLNCGSRLENRQGLVLLVVLGLTTLIIVGIVGVIVGANASRNNNKSSAVAPPPVSITTIAPSPTSLANQAGPGVISPKPPILTISPQANQALPEKTALSFCPAETSPPAYLRPEHFRALQPQFRQGGNLASVRNLYELEVVVNPTAASYSGQATITFWNGSPQPMPELVLRTYPEFFKAVGGQLTLSEAEVNGRPATLQERAPTYVVVQSGEPVAACSTARLKIKFSGKMPVRLQVNNYAVGTFYAGQGFFALGTFYPQLALWEKLSGRTNWGWTVTPVQASSDLTAAASAFYDVRLQVPTSYQLVASVFALFRALMQHQVASADQLPASCQWGAGSGRPARK